MKYADYCYQQYNQGYFNLSKYIYFTGQAQFYYKYPVRENIVRKPLVAEFKYWFVFSLVGIHYLIPITIPIQLPV